MDGRGDRPDNHSQKQAKTPEIEDLKKLCRELNRLGAKYALVGGFAMHYYGLTRTTYDIDFLVSTEKENIRKIKEALSVLPDKAIREIEETDLEKYTVVRVADEIVVDLIGKIGPVTYENAEKVQIDIDNVKIPVVDLDTLVKTKMGIREKDRLDLKYLLKVQQQLKKQEKRKRS
ncbi:MAG: hypothetical protein K6U04_04380 [Armatimonadetes bacterium]|nr:hypothetical protein [Armatimonadota bacterium]